MLTTESVLTWIKTLKTKADHYYCGLLNSKHDKSFGIYQLKQERARDIALGGLANTQTATKAISLLVHWDKSTRATENIAAELYADLEKITTTKIGDNTINYIQLLHNEPVDVGADENGICERVIEFIIHYERS